MSTTIALPQVEPIGDNHYRLVTAYEYTWEKDGVRYRIVVPEGYENDLASIPRVLWWWISPFDLGAASVPHDWIYQHRGDLPPGSWQRFEEGAWVDDGRTWTRMRADRLFGRMMRECQVSILKRRAAFLVVRELGWWAWIT